MSAGLLQLKQENYESAKALLTSAALSHELEWLPTTYFALSVAQHELGNLGRAESSYRAGCELMAVANPIMSPERLRQTRLWEEQARNTVASDWKLDVSPTWSARHSENSYAVIKVYDEAKEADNIGRLLQRVDRLARHGWHHAAIDLCNAIEDSGTASPTTHFWRGYCFERLHQFEQAVHHYEISIEDQPRVTSTKSAVALIYATGPEAVRSPERALELAEQRLRSRKDDWRALLAKGVALYHLNQNKAALDSAVRAAKSGRDQGLGQILIATIYQRQGDVRRAQRAFVAAIEKQVIDDVYFQSLYRELLQHWDRAPTANTE